MVSKALNLRDAEALIILLEKAEAVGNHPSVVSRMKELEEAIVYLMSVNQHLAGNDLPNTIVASLQYRARLLRDRHRRQMGE